METKLEYMKRVLKEIEDKYQDLTAYAGAVADDLGLNATEGDWGPFEVIVKLRQEVRTGEGYVQPHTPSHRLRNPMLMTRRELDESV